MEPTQEQSKNQEEQRLADGQPVISSAKTDKNTTSGLTKEIENAIAKAKVEALDEMRKDLKDEKVGIITLTGVFVSIFTFISVEIQILKYLCDFYKIAAFTFIFAGTLILFISLLDYIAKGWLKDKDQILGRLNYVIFIGMMLIIGGLAVTYFSGTVIVCSK